MNSKAGELSEVMTPFAMDPPKHATCIAPGLKNGQKVKIGVWGILYVPYCNYLVFVPEKRLERLIQVETSLFQFTVEQHIVSQRHKIPAVGEERMSAARPSPAVRPPQPAA